MEQKEQKGVWKALGVAVVVALAVSLVLYEVISQSPLTNIHESHSKSQTFQGHFEIRYDGTLNFALPAHSYSSSYILDDFNKGDSSVAMGEWVNGTLERIRESYQGTAFTVSDLTYTLQFMQLSRIVILWRIVATPAIDFYQYEYLSGARLIHGQQDGVLETPMSFSFGNTGDMDTNCTLSVNGAECFTYKLTVTYIEQVMMK